MPDIPIGTADSDDDDASARAAVERERAELQDFIKGLSPSDIQSGRWFSKLLAMALAAYTAKVDWHYFQEKYRGVPADAIVDQRIKMAARYAAIEGGLSATAYTAAIALTIGTAGGASPAVVPAGVATVMLDVAYLTRLQLHLAYDVAVLYRVPFDLSDPDDLWKLVRVAFTIRSGELVREGVIKGVPVVVRPVIKRFYSGPVLAAAKGLPVVGKFLLQRNLIKIGIPVVGIPLAVLVNRYSTTIVGRHARAIFRNEARVIEVAETLSERSKHPRLLLWVAWLVIKADDKISDDEALLMRHLTRVVREQHRVIEERLTHVVDLDSDEVWRQLEAEPGDKSELVAGAKRVAEVDGALNALERGVIADLRARCE
ncbi:hypothetical protein [Cellulomonas sp.]|uniref:hypothetical protein n=1 Tax=Cellulomonas sp. TaxID=40001 RepID=UPI003BA88D0D